MTDSPNETLRLANHLGRAVFEAIDREKLLTLGLIQDALYRELLVVLATDSRQAATPEVKIQRWLETPVRFEPQPENPPAKIEPDRYYYSKTPYQWRVHLHSIFYGELVRRAAVSHVPPYPCTHSSPEGHSWARVVSFLLNNSSPFSREHWAIEVYKAYNMTEDDGAWSAQSASTRQAWRTVVDEFQSIRSAHG